MAENTNSKNGIVEGLEEDGAQHVRLAIKRQLPVQRIDKYLKNRFKEFSRSMIQRLIQEKAVTVNERPTKASYQLKGGDRVDVLLPPPPSDEIEPEPIPLDILYEDEHMLAVNKQADLIVHPARGNQRGRWSTVWRITVILYRRSMVSFAPGLCIGWTVTQRACCW